MSTFKDINVKNLYISDKPVSDYIYEDYYSENAWCYQKYASGVCHIYRNGEQNNFACTKTYGSTYYSDEKTWNISVPNIKIIKICNFISNVHAQDNNGLFWINNRDVSIFESEENKIQWNFMVCSAVSVSSIWLLISADIWIRFEEASQ